MNTLVLHLVSVLVLAIAVEAACRLGRFRPALCHALWLVVLVKLIVPPVVAWPVSSETLATLYSVHETTNDSRTEGVGEGGTRQGFMEGGWALGLGQNGAPSDTGEASIGLETALLGLWAFGAIAVAGRIALQVRRGRRRIAAGVALPEWLQTQLAHSCALLGVAVPHAVITREIGGVYVQITGRPTLVISAEALEHVGPEQWHTILIHELAHLKRRDHWVAWLMLAAGAVWWWNPCFWWVRNRIHLYSEMACDAWVVNVHPGDRKQYAETMVRIMAMLSRQDAPAPEMGLAAWSASTQERRLWMIMKAKGGCRVSWLAAVGVIALAALAVPGCRTTDEDIERAGATKTAGWVLSLAPAESLEATLAQPANVEFEDIHVKDIFEFIQDTFELNVVVDQRVIKPQPMEGMATASDRPQGGRPYASDGMVPYIILKDTPLGEFLKALTKPLQLTTQRRGHAVWIGTAEQFKLDESVTLPSAEFSEGAILDTLKSPVNIEFEQIHIKEVLAFIVDNFEINTVIDKRAIADEGADFNTPRSDSPGYTTDGMIEYINQKNVPLGEALYAITRLLNLTYAVKENYIFISSPELINSVDAAPPAK
jgi:beta-lactamase regulating signal transducer with metallopeptidase domain